MFLSILLPVECSFLEYSAIIFVFFLSFVFSSPLIVIVIVVMYIPTDGFLYLSNPLHAKLFVITCTVGKHIAECLEH